MIAYVTYFYLRQQFKCFFLFTGMFNDYACHYCISPIQVVSIPNHIFYEGQYYEKVLDRRV